MRGTKWLAFGAGLTLAACVTTQQVQVTLSPAPASAQWQGAWGGSIGGGVTALPGGGLTFPAGQILAPDGSAALPSYSFTGNPDLGLFRIGNAAMMFSAGGNSFVLFGYHTVGQGLLLRGGSLVAWAPGDPAGATGDLVLARDSAGILALRGGTGVTGASINFGIPSVPGTPAASTGVLYMKADKKLYFKNDAGVETALF